MFGLLKPKLVDPVVIEALIEIDAPRESVFDLLDFTSPSNALRARGYVFKENLFGLGRYCATHADAPGVVYHFEMDDCLANIAIGFRSWLECAGEDSVVTAARSDYVLVGMTDETCRLELVETAALKPGTGKKAAARERAAMAASVDEHLRQLKLYAEYGADADVAA